MRNAVRITCAALFLAALTLFSGISYYAYSLPEQYSVLEGEKIYLGENLEVKRNFGQDKGVPTSSTLNNTESQNAKISLFKIFPIKDATVKNVERSYVVAGGDVFGIKLYTKGVIVIRIQQVVSGSQKISPGELAGLKVGDSITAINSKTVEQISDVSSAFENSTGETLKLTVEREGEQSELDFTPVMSDADGGYKGGIWVRDSSAGIGTATYYDNVNGIFAGLGHAVCDVDTGEIMPLSNGECVGAQISACVKSSDKVIGELVGSMTQESIATLEMNTPSGIYGKLKDGEVFGEPVPVALKQEVKCEKAQIISTVDGGEPQYYDVEIKKIYSNSHCPSKNMLIEVTDERLIAKTGGIVQGMSGSPIIQNGMLVGAVTHVLVNNPLEGYAIFAENMVETSKEIKSDTKNAS